MQTIDFVSNPYIGQAGNVDPAPIVREEFWQGSNRLYIMFGGILGSMGLSPFELAASGKILDYSRIFIRDPYQSWYQRGLPGIGDNIHSVARFLEDRIKASGAGEIRFVGNCMGGYAAILMCSLLKVGRAIAFSPQSFISPEKLKALGEIRVLDHLHAMHLHRTAEHIYDLRSWLQKHSPDLSADIFVCKNFPLDLLHTNELSEFKNINIRYFDHGGHHVIVHLYHLGLLHEILSA